MQHHFDIEIANKYGVNVAIFLNNLAFWIHKNIANKKHEYDGSYWTYNSVEAYTLLFPYWTYKQLRKIIKDCVENGLILEGNYNKSPYDRTKWYALSDLGLSLFKFPTCPRGQMKMASGANENGDVGNSSYTDINTDNKTHIILNREVKKPSRQKIKIDCPSDFSPNASNINIAAQHRLNLTDEKISFLDYHASKGNKFKDWHLAFNTWLRNANKFNQQRGGNYVKKESAAERMHRLCTGNSNPGKNTDHTIDLDQSSFHQV
jgi:hypothetical protein